MNIVRPFGPEIGETSLPVDINQQLLSICNDMQNVAERRTNHRLVGYVEKEFDILDKIKDSVLPTIHKAITDYLSKSNNIYSSYAPFSKFDLVCTDAWCNMQEAGEYNPIHNHLMSDVVCVIFPFTDIDHTHKKYITNNPELPPGSLVFHSPSNSGRFGPDGFVATPKTGDMYIFPATLYHYTTPFYKQGDTRISVSCNFSFTDLFYSLRRVRGFQ